MRLKALLATLLILPSLYAFAAAFGNDVGGSWADTPKGRFECRNDASTKYLQRITVGAALIYQERGTNNPDGNGGPNLSDGILVYDPGCAIIIANERGYAVIVRSIQPPHYGVSGYGIIDFNRHDFPVIELGQGQHPRDSKIKNRLMWAKTGLTLNFFGFLVEEESASTNSPLPKSHQVRFSFTSGKVDVIK